MNTPAYLRALGENVERLMQQYSTSVIENTARRIASMGFSEATLYEIQKLEEAGYLYQDILDAISKIIGGGPAAESELRKEITKAYVEAATRSLEYDNRIYTAAGLSPAPLHESESLMRILRLGIEQTNNELVNLVRTTASNAQAAFIAASDIAYMQVADGTLSASQAIAQAVKKAAQGGVYVLYRNEKTGKTRRDRIEVAVRRNIQTSVSQTVGRIQIENAKLLGTDLMEITAHAGCRDSHLFFQGRLVSLSGRVGYLSLSDIGYGDAAGFKGCNCRHDWFPFIEGVSELVYDREALIDYENATVVFDEHEMPMYQATQKQRLYERTIRKTKDELLGLQAAMTTAKPSDILALQTEYNATAVKLRKQRGRLEDFQDQTGLIAQKERQQVYGFGRSEASKAVWAARKAM